MKKIIYSISVLLTSLFFTRSAHAIWPDFTPAIPFAPQLCVMCIPPAISVAVSYYDQVMELKEDLKKYTDISTLKQMAVSYASKMGQTAFNKWRQNKNTRARGVSHARTIEDSKIADLKDEASVKNAFVKLFLQYPSDKARVEETYKSIGDQLKMDTTLEMYLIAVEMEKKLYGNNKGQKDNNNSKNMEDLGLLKQIDLIESCLVQGENCDTVGLQSCQEATGGDSETKEDHACFWKSALQAEKLYDEIMRNNLLLIAMQAQYQAVLGINNLAKIKEYEKEETEKDKKKNDKSSFLLEKYFQPSFKTAKSIISAEVAFADLTPDEEKASEGELSGYEDSLLSKENIIDGNFEDASNPDGFTTAIGEREDDVASMEIIEDVRANLNLAQKIHNLKQTLPEYKKVYQDYADVQAKMEQAKANLQASGECILNMMQPYYENPNEVWLGGKCSYYRDGQILCHYEPEKSADDFSESAGLFDILCPDDSNYNCYIQELRSSNITGGVAKYLMTLYAAAKDEDAAGDTEAFIEEDSETLDGGYVSRTNITTGGKDSEVKRDNDSIFASSRNSDETMDDANVKKMTTQTSDSGSGESVSNLKDQEKGDEEKEQARKDGLIRWVIGSEVAKELALDLDTGENNWGTRSKKFPLWNDQIAFYQQYIDGKYDNIEEYINSMSQVDVLLELANTLNKIYPYKTIEGIPPISAETQRKNAANALEELVDKLKDVKSGLLKAIGMEDSEETQKMTFDEIAMEQINNAINEENNRMDAIRKKYEEERATKLNLLKTWYSIMNDANTKMSDINENYNKNNEEVKKGEATTPEASEGLDYSKKIYANRKLSQDSPQNSDFNGTVNSNKINSATARANQTKYGNTAASLEKIVKQAEKNVEKIKEDLDVMRRNYVKQLSDAESSEKTKFTSFVEELRAERQISVWASATDSIEPLALSNKLLQCVKQHALQQVANAKTEIQKLKDNQLIYYVEGAPLVQKIHEKMIKNITQIPLTELAECAAIGEIKDFDEKSEEDITPVINIFEDICKDDFCVTPSGAYFVGAIGLPEDFSAPKPPLDFSSAPLHEVFHFDVIDFNNVDKYYEDKDDIYSNKKMYTSFESFLAFLNASSSGFEYGGKTYDSTIPIIWKYILKRHAFVQKEMDLTPLLGTAEETGDDALAANSDIMILRAGVFPCVAEKKYAIDVAEPEELKLPAFLKKKIETPFYTYTLNRKPTTSNNEYDNLPLCRAVKLQLDKGQIYISDTESGMSVKVDKVSNLNEGATRSSELGMIMSYVVDESTVLTNILKAKLFSGQLNRASLPHRLTFNQKLLDAIAVINKTEDITKEPEAIKFYLASRLMYDRNQFGDYLDQVEYENIVADTMEKVEKQITEINSKIGEVFISADYTMSDDFNLLNEKDYEAAAKVMDEQKNIYLDLAIQKLQSMPKGAGASQNLRDKSMKLLRKIAVLQKDSDEVVAVSGNEELDELEEKIKQQKADKSVSEKYKEKDLEEQEREKKHVQAPYCAFYPITGAISVNANFGGGSSGTAKNIENDFADEKANAEQGGNNSKIEEPIDVDGNQNLSQSGKKESLDAVINKGTNSSAVGTQGNNAPDVKDFDTKITLSNQVERKDSNLSAASASEAKDTDTKITLSNQVERKDNNLSATGASAAKDSDSKMALSAQVERKDSNLSATGASKAKDTATDKMVPLNAQKAGGWSFIGGGF